MKNENDDFLQEMSQQVGISLNLEEFAKWTWEMSLLKKDDKGLAETALGLAGETGEVIECVKKHIRDGVIDKEKLEKELGDVLHYWAKLINYYDLSPYIVLSTNVQKITSRRNRGTLQGSGDNR